MYVELEDIDSSIVWYWCEQRIQGNEFALKGINDFWFLTKIISLMRDFIAT